MRLGTDIGKRVDSNIALTSNTWLLFLFLFTIDDHRWLFKHGRKQPEDGGGMNSTSFFTRSRTTRRMTTWAFLGSHFKIQVFGNLGKDFLPNGMQISNFPPSHLHLQALSRLYRHRLLQVNTRWKVPGKIYFPRLTYFCTVRSFSRFLIARPTFTHVFHWDFSGWFFEAFAFEIPTFAPLRVWDFCRKSSNVLLHLGIFFLIGKTISSSKPCHFYAEFQSTIVGILQIF